MKTFSDLVTAVLNRIKQPSTDADILTAVKESLNTRYESIAFRKKWRWRSYRWDMKITKKYTTGTIAVVNDTRTITGTATVWTENHIGWFVRVTGTDDIYKLISINTAAQTAILSSSYIGTSNATATYTLFQYTHGLPPDSEEVDMVWHDYRRTPLEIISPREFVDRQVMYPTLEGKAQACTVGGFKAYRGPALGEFVLGYDYLNSEAENDLQLLVFPIIPAEDYTLHAELLRKITLMVADTDEPLIPVEKRHILIYGSIADMMFRATNQEAGAYFERKFETLVNEMESDYESTDNRPVMSVDCRRYYRNPQWVRMSRNNRFDYD